MTKHFFLCIVLAAFCIAATIRSESIGKVQPPTPYGPLPSPRQLAEPK